MPATSTTATVTGLTNGQTYTFRVAAVNANGTGPDSAASNAVTPLNPVVPSAPTGVAARPATNSAQVTWTPAANNGDSAITSQTITPVPRGRRPGAGAGLARAPRSTTVTGLDNGYGYTFRVRATNGVGAGPQSSESIAVTPQTTIFDFPIPPIVDAGDAFAVELGMKFTADLQRHDHRHPLLQGRGQHRDPRRQPVDDRRHQARHRDLHERDRLRAGRP